MNSRRSFDHLVGGGEQLGGTVEVEESGGLCVDDQLEFGRLDHRQVRRLSALENAAGIAADLAIGICKVCSVSHEPADGEQSRFPHVAGTASRDARLTNWTRRLVKEGLVADEEGVWLFALEVAKAALISRMVLALSTWIFNPKARAAVSTFRIVVSVVAQGLD